MLAKADFTAEEWSVIRRAPFAAGLVVVAASPNGPFGVIKEMLAVSGTLIDVKLHGAPGGLVKAIAADLYTAEARQQSIPVELQAKAPDQLRTSALDACRQAAAIVEKKGEPAEAQAFKGWLVSVGKKVAEAAKEGGFLGFGGTRVSEREMSALKDLTAALDANPR